MSGPWFPHGIVRIRGVLNLYGERISARDVAAVLPVNSEHQLDALHFHTAADIFSRNRSTALDESLMLMLSAIASVLIHPQRPDRKLAVVVLLGQSWGGGRVFPPMRAKQRRRTRTACDQLRARESVLEPPLPDAAWRRSQRAEREGWRAWRLPARFPCCQKNYHRRAPPRTGRRMARLREARAAQHVEDGIGVGLRLPGMELLPGKRVRSVRVTRPTGRRSRTGPTRSRSGRCTCRSSSRRSDRMRTSGSSRTGHKNRTGSWAPFRGVVESPERRQWRGRQSFCEAPPLAAGRRLRRPLRLTVPVLVVDDRILVRAGERAAQA